MVDNTDLNNLLEDAIALNAIDKNDTKTIELVTTLIEYLNEDKLQLDKFTTYAVKNDFLPEFIIARFIDILNKEENKTHMNYYYLLRVIPLIVEHPIVQFAKIDKFYKDEQLYRVAYTHNANITRTMTEWQMLYYLSNSKVSKLLRSITVMFTLAKIAIQPDVKG